MTPTSFGANRTVSLQLPSAGSVAPGQLPPVMRKLFGFWPASPTFEIVMGPFVLFVSVSVLGVENVPAWCGRLNRTGDGLKTTADGVPVPDTFTVCGGAGCVVVHLHYRARASDRRGEELHTHRALVAGRER